MLIIADSAEIAKRHAEWLSLVAFCNPIPLDQSPQRVRDAVPGGAEWAGTIVAYGADETPRTGTIAGGSGGMALEVDLGILELEGLEHAVFGDDRPEIIGPEPVAAGVTILDGSDVLRHAATLLPLLAAAQPVAVRLLSPDVLNAIRATTSESNSEDMFASAWGSCLTVDGTPVYFAGPYGSALEHGRKLIVSAPAELVARWFGETTGKVASNGNSKRKARKAVPA